jgi:phage terminase large subunit GpA-like protein
MGKENELDGLLGGFRNLFKSREHLNCLSWNEKNRRLGTGGRFHAYPWQRAWLLAPEEPDVSEIVIKSGAQVLGKSEALLSTLAYCVVCRPADYLVVLPSLPMAERWSRTKFANTVAMTPALAELLPGEGKKALGGSLLFKKLTNGASVAVTGANSASSLAAASISGLFFDEISLAPRNLTGEGSSVALAKRRLASFKNSFYFSASTPSTEGECTISESYELSSRHKWTVPCPSCGHRFSIQFSDIVWDSPEGQHRPESARLRCPECKAEHSDSTRVLMVMNGEWVAENPAEVRIKGFWLSGFNVMLPARKGYVSRLHEFVSEFLAVRKNPSSLQPWVNGVCGETFAPDVLRPVSAEYLIQRKENFFNSDEEPDPATHDLPEKILVIVGAVDVQSNRLESLLVGFGRGHVSWLLDHRIWPGNPSLPETWNPLGEYLSASWRAPGWQAPDKRLAPSLVFVDSGFLSPIVYAFCARRMNCFASRGLGLSTLPLVEIAAGKRGVTGGLRLIHTDATKQLFYTRIRIDDREAEGFVHIHTLIGADFLRQVTSETATRDARTGQIRFKLMKNASNEGLDLCVMAVAAEYHGRPRYDTLEAERRGVATLPPEEMQQHALSPLPPRKPRPRRPSIWGRGGIGNI